MIKYSQTFQHRGQVYSESYLLIILHKQILKERKDNIVNCIIAQNVYFVFTIHMELKRYIIVKTLIFNTYLDKS